MKGRRRRRRVARASSPPLIYHARFTGGGPRTGVTFQAKSDAAAVRYATGLLRAKIGAKRCISVKRAPGRASSKGPRRRGNPAGRAELEHAARAFEDFTGREASRVERHAGLEHRAGWLLGRVAAISYIATRDGETAEYVHRFKRRSRPQLVSSHDGSQLYLLGGAYSVTDRGIEDA